MPQPGDSSHRADAASVSPARMKSSEAAWFGTQMHALTASPDSVGEEPRPEQGPSPRTNYTCQGATKARRSAPPNPKRFNFTHRKEELEELPSNASNVAHRMVHHHQGPSTGDPFQGTTAKYRI